MNVLVLTPDAVGSTLLQRLLTIYMQFHEFDRPVINLHELTNGLTKYYSSDFNCEILGKKNVVWGYHQSLEQILDLLRSVDHYKVARLAQYHIHQRQDTVQDQTMFYRYLNDNFFVVSCRRQNLFEHALSWCFNKVTRKLNVYSAQEKIHTFLDLYQHGITVDTTAFYHTLRQYKQYLQWVEQNFQVGSYFVYEQHLPKIEQYILDLPVFVSQRKKITWQDTFDIDFGTWNKYHYLASDIGSLALDRPQQFSQIAYSAQSQQGSEEHTALTLLHNALTPQHQQFLTQHRDNYIKAADCIQKMQDLGIIINGPPVKKQTLAEKRFITKNFDQLVTIYNDWADKNNDIASPIDLDSLNSALVQERTWWQPPQTNQLDNNIAQMIEFEESETKT